MPPNAAYALRSIDRTARLFADARGAAIIAYRRRNAILEKTATERIVCARSDEGEGAALVLCLAREAAIRGRYRRYVRSSCPGLSIFRSMVKNLDWAAASRGAAPIATASNPTRPIRRMDHPPFRTAALRSVGNSGKFVQVAVRGMRQERWLDESCDAVCTSHAPHLQLHAMRTHVEGVQGTPPCRGRSIGIFPERSSGKTPTSRDGRTSPFSYAAVSPDIGAGGEKTFPLLERS